MRCLRYRTTLRFDFLHSFIVCTQSYAFQVHRQTGDQPTKMSFLFSLHLIFACRLVLYLYACAVEIPKFQDSKKKLIQKTRVFCCSVTQTNNARIQKYGKIADVVYSKYVISLNGKKHTLLSIVLQYFNHALIKFGFRAPKTDHLTSQTQEVVLNKNIHK